MTEIDRGEWLQTYSGLMFHPRDPRPEDVEPNDIAHGLSLVCRFGGQCTDFYSVAQHSVLVARFVERIGGTLMEQFWGLLHDASEAYIGDVIWPVKQAAEMRGYKAIEARVMGAICKRFRIPIVQPAIVKHADLVLLATEKRDLMRGTAKTIEREVIAARDETLTWHCDHVEPIDTPIDPWGPKQAESTFLTMYNALFHKVHAR